MRTVDPVCTNPNCNRLIKPEPTEEVPRIISEISDIAIDNILAENLEIFHVHQYGSMVIFMEFMEGLDPDDALIDEYSKQGHVFVLPIKPMDLVNLKDNKIKHLTYKAQDDDRLWYRVVLVKKNKSVFKKLFH